MNDKLKTELLRLLYAAIGAAIVAFLQTILQGFTTIHIPETSSLLNMGGAALAARLK